MSFFQNIDLIPYIALGFAYFLGLMVSGRILNVVVSAIDKATTNDTSKPFNTHNVQAKFSRFIAIFIIYAGVKEFLHLENGVHEFLMKLFGVILCVVALRLIYSLLNVGEDIYQYRTKANEIPITGFIQAIKVILGVGAILVCASIILGKSPTVLLGSAAAVLTLIAIGIRDTLLGFVNGFQVIANRVISVGDWIEVPKFGANGYVKKIGLNIITVQNWNKTYSVIPTHAIMNTPIKNWRGMSKSGVRQIQRHINIDQKSILKLSHQDIEKLCAEYAFEAPEGINNNATLFRFWVKEYITNHPFISNVETVLIRAKQPTPEGMPLEFYAYCTVNEWVPYEEIQSLITEVIIEAAGSFGLKIYQRVSDSNGKL